jgi:hypothetical protein
MLVGLIDSIISLFERQTIFRDSEWGQVCDLDAQIGAECIRLGIVTPRVEWERQFPHKPWGACSVPHALRHTTEFHEGRRVWVHEVLISEEWLQAMRILSRAAIEQLTPIQARKKFCFDQWEAGKTLKEINVALKHHPVWESYADDKYVRRPINSWAKTIGVKPRAGQRGRRTKSAHHETPD